ncbi:MAG: hypothetical protein F4X02_03755 [Chloroflexi bacterium]|nr:hypothetical protein [Chloroflexota bacterium]
MIRVHADDRMSNLMNRPRALERLPWQWLLPSLFLLVGLVYLYAAPNFEASDSAQHIGVIQWIAERGELPVQSPDHAQLFGQEASQPPLYYLLMAAVWNAFDTADFDERYKPSPFTAIGVPARWGNRNLLIYKQVYPPDLSGSSLALYAIRFLSLCMGAGAVAAVYQATRTALPGQPRVALLAASLAAFNPQFLFISASVSNDALINLLAALLAWRMLVMLRDGFDTRRSLLLALLITLAASTKLSGLTVAAVVGLAALWTLAQRRDFRGFALLAGATLALTLIIAGPWYLRNLSLYGELFGTATMLDHFGRREISPWRLLTEEFQGLRVSYWAVFGAFNILAHETFYHIMDLLSLVGAAGLLLCLWRFRRDRPLLASLGFLALLLLLGAVMLFWWTLQTWASTGRLLFPYITSISLLLALGLSAWRFPPLLIAAPLLAFSLAAPFLYIMPNYDHPPPVSELPESAKAANVQWGDLRLSGYELPPPTTVWRAGDSIPVSFYWRAEAQSPLAYALVLSLLGADGAVLSSIETWPGWGTFPHPWMQHHTDYRDDYVMEIPPGAAATSELALEIRWYVFPDGPALDAVQANGERLTALRLPLGSVTS